MEYITKKLPRDAETLLHRFQATHVLNTGEKLNDGQAMKKALEIALESESARKKTKKYQLSDLKGFIKDGPPSNAATDVDQVVYGI